MRAFAGTAQLIRIMRANLLDELRKPYVMTARAKGISERRCCSNIRFARRSTRLLEQFPPDVNHFSCRGFPRARKSDSGSSVGSGGGAR